MMVDNASYHWRNADNFQVSKWRKGQLQSWSKETIVPFRPDALRSGLWMLRRAEKRSKVIDDIAKLKSTVMKCYICPRIIVI